MIRTDTSPLPTSTDLSQTQERETTLAFNVFKGLAILEVIIHHSSGMALRFLQSESLLYGVLAFINRTLHFAVPAFLFMSALLLARSALGKPFKVRTFLERRFVRSALPYVVWTVLYTLFKVVTTPLTFPEIFKLESIQVLSGTHVVPTATVTLATPTGPQQHASSGDGPVDAAYKAINHLANVFPSLESYRIEAVTEGGEALGEVSIRARVGEIIYSGNGVSTDIVEASARAWLEVINASLANVGVKKD